MSHEYNTRAHSMYKETLQMNKFIQIVETTVDMYSCGAVCNIRCEVQTDKSTQNTSAKYKHICVFVQPTICHSLYIYVQFHHIIVLL